MTSKVHFEILAENGFDFISDEVIYTGATYTPEEAEVIGYDTFWYPVYCHIPPVSERLGRNAEPLAFFPSERIFAFFSPAPLFETIFNLAKCTKFFPKLFIFFVILSYWLLVYYNI